jgi:3-oxoadipate enol-lactonase
MLADILGTRIFHEVTGEGPALVFMHGLGGTSNIWQAQRNVLSKFHKVVTFDLPGSGRSDKTAREYSMARWVEQIAALADHLQLENFVLVGHSMTTVLAQNFAARHGDRLRGVVLCGPITELPAAGKDAFRKRAELVQREGMIAVADAVLAGGLTPATREANAALAGLWRDVLLSNDPPSYAAQCLALVHASAASDQWMIKCPLLILVGDQDAVTPLANARAIAAAVPHAQIRIIPATAHMTMLERPEAFNAALLEFLATQAQG